MRAVQTRPHWLDTEATINKAAEPVVGRRRLVVADSDTSMVGGQRHAFDLSGHNHYSRPDVFFLEADWQRRSSVHFHG